MMCLGHCHNVRYLQIFSKEMHCAHHREEDAEAILDLPLRLSLYECGNLRGVGRGMGPIGDEYLHCLGIPRGSVCAGIPFSIYDCMRDADRLLTRSIRITSVFCCLEARNDRRDGPLRIFLEVALAVAPR